MICVTCTQTYCYKLSFTVEWDQQKWRNQILNKAKLIILPNVMITEITEGRLPHHNESGLLWNIKMHDDITTTSYRLLSNFKLSWIYNTLRSESIDVKCVVVKISKRFQQLAYIDMQWPDTNFLNEDKWKVFMYSLCLNGFHNGRIPANIRVLIEVDIIYHTISRVYKLSIPTQYLYNSSIVQYFFVGQSDGSVGL